LDAVLLAVRIAFVALAQNSNPFGVIRTAPVGFYCRPESTVKAPGLESASRARHAGPNQTKRRIDWGIAGCQLMLSASACCGSCRTPGYGVMFAVFLAGRLCLRWCCTGLASGRLGTAEALA
jgi:hypothetical protein